MKLVRTIFSSYQFSSIYMHVKSSCFPPPSLSWGDRSIGRGDRGTSSASFGSQLWRAHFVSLWHICRGRFVPQVLWCPHLHEQGTYFCHQQWKSYIYHLVWEYVIFPFLGKGTEVTICIDGATSTPWDFGVGPEMESYSGDQVGRLYDWWQNADSRRCRQC